jgi:hypothetical protein
MWGNFPFAVPGKQSIEIVAVRSIRPERMLVKKALDAAPEAHLIGALVGSNRPAHFAMPATPQQHDGRTSYPGGYQAERPPA